MIAAILSRAGPSSMSQCACALASVESQLFLIFLLAGTMMSPAGQIGTWSMEWISSDPEASVIGLKSVRRTGDGGDADGPSLDPAGMPMDAAVAEP